MYKKFSGRVCLPPTGEELVSSKDCHHWNIIMYWTGKVDLLYGSTLPQIRTISRNASNKSCWTINFVQKSQWVYMCISTWSGDRGSKNFHNLNIIMYWNGKADLLYGSTVPQIRIISRNASNKSCWVIKFVQKSKWAHLCISTKIRDKELQKLISFKYYMYWNGKVNSLYGSTLPKLCII